MWYSEEKDVWPGNNLCKNHWAHAKFPWHIPWVLPENLAHRLSPSHVWHRWAYAHNTEIDIEEFTASDQLQQISFPCWYSNLWCVCIALNHRWPSWTLQVYINASKVLVMEALSVCNAVLAFDTYFPTTERHRPASIGRTCTELVELMSSNQNPPPPNNKLLQLKKPLANAQPLKLIIALHLQVWRMCLSEYKMVWKLSWGTFVKPWRGWPYHFAPYNFWLQPPENVRVVSDDADVLALLLQFYASNNYISALYMSSPKADRTLIDVKVTAKKHPHVAQHILPVHALTGVDTVPGTFGIRKNKKWMT